MTLILAAALSMLALLQPPAQPADAAQLRARLDAAAQLMDSDLSGAAEALDHLAVDSIELRRVRLLSAEERPVHARLFALRARAHIQLIHNDKAQESLRELLRVDPSYAGELAPREQELLDELRKAEGGVLEVSSPERDARVLVNGVESGVTSHTPLRVPLIAGVYDVRLEKPGFKAADRRVTVAAAQTTSVADLAPQRNVPPLAFVTDREGIEVSADSVVIGRTAKLQALQKDLSPAESAALDRMVAGAGVDPQNAAAIVMRQAAVDRPITMRFRRDCFVEEVRPVTVTSDAVARLDPAEPILPLGNAAIVKMQADVGTLRVTSTPPDADVLIDGQLAGRTPFDRAVCAGSRRVRVRHKIGSYSVAVTVSRGRTEVVDVPLKPDLAFLGALEDAAGAMAPSAALTTMVDRAIGATITAFHLATTVDLPPELPPWSERSNPDLVAAADRGDADAVTRLLKQASYTYDAPLMMVAVRRPAGTGGEASLDLIFFWRDHGMSDRIRVQPPTDSAIAAVLRQINDPPAPSALVYRNEAGLRVADTTLPGAALIVGAVVPGSPAAAAGVKPGDTIQAIDGAAATAAQFAQRVAAKQPGEILTLRVAGPGTTAPRDVPVPIQRRPAQAPAFDRTVAGNALIARLTAGAQATAGVDRDLLSFSEALTHMRYAEWKAAFQLLSGINTLPQGTGVGPGALAFYRARCQEGLGDRDQAVALYTQAMTATEEWLADDGSTVASAARYRLAELKTAK